MNHKYDQIRMLMGFENKYSDLFSNEFWYKAKKLHKINLRIKSSGLPRWPKNCYIPDQMWFDLFMSEGIPESVFDEVRPYFSTMAAWCDSLLTYRIERQSRQFALKTVYPDKLPVINITNFINSARYIELVDCSDVRGFFISLDYDFINKSYILRILVDVYGSSKRYPFVVYLGDWSLEDGIKKGLENEFVVPDDELNKAVAMTKAKVEPLLKIINCFDGKIFEIEKENNSLTKNLMRTIKQSMGVKEYNVHCNN
jgi:hypothetical protein